MSGIVAHFLVLVLASLFLSMYFHFASCLDSRDKTLSLWLRLDEWINVFSKPKDEITETEFNHLMEADRADMEKLLTEKIIADNQKREDLAARQADLPQKAAAAAAKAAAAHYLNKR